MADFPLRIIYWYVSGSCNLSCRHCWIDPAPSSEPIKVLPWQSWYPVFSEARAMGVTSIKLTGGEPLLHPEIKEILPALKELGFHLSMETNGLLIDAEMADLLKACKVAVAISLDGHEPHLHDGLRGRTGSFVSTLEGISHLQRTGSRFQVICCLRRENHDSIYEMPGFVRRLGASSLKINPISGTARSAEMSSRGELLSVREVIAVYEEMTQRLARDPFPVMFDIPPAFRTLKDLSAHGFGTCGILNILGFLHNGRAGLCGIGEHTPELDFGPATAQTLRSIWEENPVLIELRRSLPQRLRGACPQCQFRQYCLGKCLAHTFQKTNDLYSGFGFCDIALREGLFPTRRQKPGARTTSQALPLKEKA